MRHVLVTGMSGTGKSTLSSALKQRGMNAVDLDEYSDVCWMYYKESGKPVETDFQNSNLAWVHSVEWLCNIDALQRLMSEQSALTFYCGSADNVEDMILLFDLVFLLHLDHDSLRRRLEDRTNNDWARTDEVQNWLIERQESYEKKLIDNGAIVLDATKSVDELVSAIIFNVEL